jgi:hypothetical protein
MGGKTQADVANFEDIFPYGIAFDVYIQPLTNEEGEPIAFSEGNWQFLKTIFIREKSENAKQFKFEIRNLPYGRYYVKLKPYTTAPSSTSNTIKLSCTGENAEITTPYTLRGKNVGLRGEFSSQPSNQDMAKTINYDEEKRIVSSESGAPIRITTVSEVVIPSEISKIANYKGVAIVGVKIKASDRISSSPEVSFFVSEGRKIRNHLHYGTQQSLTPSNQITDTTVDYSEIPELTIGQTKVRNLDTKQEGGVTALSNNRITAGITLNPKDRYIVFNYAASNYFPDIYVDWLINPEGGLGAVIDGDEDIDYPSIVETRKFVRENGFFWDGVISETESLSSKVTQEAGLSLLYPYSPNGLFGLTMENEDRLPIAVFNSSNILKDSFEESVLPWQDTSVNQVIVVYTDGTDNQRPATAVIARTQELDNGWEKLNSITIQAPSITNPEQAKTVAGVTLNSKRLQDRNIRFRTATQGLFLSPGEAILVQHQTTEFSYELSGYVTETEDYDTLGQTQRVLLSRYPSPFITSDYRATIQLQTTGEVITDLPFTLEQVGGKTYMNLSELPSPVSLYDPVVVGRDMIENKVYRIQSLSISESGEISIDAVIWSDKLFDFTNLEFIFQ